MQIYREQCQVISLKKMNSAGICQEDQYCRPNHTPLAEARTLAAEGVEVSGLTSAPGSWKYGDQNTKLITKYFHDESQNLKEI